MLAQAYPSADTNYTLYTSPLGSEVGVSLFICNHASDADIVDVAVVPSGETLGDKHYILKSVILEKTVQIIGLKLDGGDSVIVKSVNGTSSFSLSGVVL